MTNNLSYNKRQQVLACSLFIISPVLSLPLIIDGVYRNRTYGFVLLALFMGLCAILFPPFADLYRHTLSYFRYLSYPEEGFIVTKQGLDFTLYTLSNLFAKMGINFEMIRFIFTVFCYLATFYIYRDITNKNSFFYNNRRLFMIGFFCVFLAVPFIWIVNGLRYSTAAYMVLLAYYLIFIKKNAKGWFWMLFGFFTHFGVLMVILPAIFVKLFRFIKIGRSLVIVMCFAALILSSLVLDQVVDQLAGSELESGGQTYIENTDQFSDARSFRGFIANLLERTMLPFLILYIFSLNKRDVKEDYIQLSFYLIISVIIVRSYMILFERLTLFVIPFLMIVSLIKYDGTRYRRKLLNWILICTVISFCAYLYGYRDPLIRGRIYQIVYKPVPLIMFNTYDHAWINENLNIGGHFK